MCVVITELPQNYDPTMIRSNIVEKITQYLNVIIINLIS